MADTIPRFINREQSWLGFNRRVLDEAMDESIPLLERLKFLAITSSNLDEFFMVRVGGLQILLDRKEPKTDFCGLTPAQQLAEISRQTHRMVEEQYGCFLNIIEPELARAGIRRLQMKDLTPQQDVYVERLFEHEIFPLITPMAIEPDDPFPLLPGLRVNVFVRLKQRRTSDDSPRFAVVAMPKGMARFITIPTDEGYHYIPLEEVVAAFLDRLFPGEPILEGVPFRITRNADMSVREDQAGDLLEEMKEVLTERKQSACVRLEISDAVSSVSLGFLKNALEIDEEDVYRIPGPLDLSSYFRIATMAGFEKLKIEPWPPQSLPDVKPGESIFDLIARRDVLLFHPYDSFDPVQRLVEEAADDPDVLAIKQILYRTSENSPIVAALARAAEHDKHVTAVVELKARFDEARNIEWATALEHSGVQVIYGLRGLKTHAKICVVVRREPTGIRRYVHYGTGNYNEKTARLYSDIGYMTCNEDYGADATTFFNTITGYSQPVRFRKIESAPIGLKARIIELIENEAERQKQGQKALILAKMNSLAHPEIIEALYKASKAGVKIQLNIRGICCLRPGVPDLSENITVTGIVDRFLEHSRVFYFHNGGEERVLISSADWMPRNLDRRVELLIPVEDEACRKRLTAILETFFQDTVKARQLMADGQYKKIEPAPRKKAVRAQEVFYRQACEASRKAETDRTVVFEPQRPTASGNGP